MSEDKEKIFEDFIQKMVESQQDMDEEYQEILNQKFWELLDESEASK